MIKKKQSTYDKFLKTLNTQERKDFDQEYRDLLLSEMLIAVMKQDNVSVRKLAKAACISPTIIQGMRSGTRKNVSIQSFFKILKALGFSLLAERHGTCFPLDISRLNRK